ncbi:MAG TPA: hypothetical protein VE959_32655 [Bryobacteraceae bacterium]|nr:hypothetical protein [Bryobacteraceae bacterium]
MALQRFPPAGVAGRYVLLDCVDPPGAAYARAEQIADDIVTTEEVLTEYLTFFCASPEYFAPGSGKQRGGHIA